MPQTFTPTQLSDETSSLVASLIYARLYKQNPDGKVIPYAVQNEMLSKQACSVSLALKPKYPTALDFQKAFEALQSSGRFLYLYKNIKQFQAIGTRTLFIQLDCHQNFNAIWQLQKFYFSMPQMSVGNPQNLTGDFKNMDISDDKLILRSPRLNLVFYILPSAAGAWFFFRRERLDIYKPRGIYRFMPPAAGFEKKVKPALKVLYGAIVSQDKQDILSQQAFRQALNHAFPRKKICKKVLLNACIPADYPVPPILSKALSEKYPYQKKALIGFAQKARIPIYTPPDKTRQQIARVLYFILKKAGFQPQLNVVDTGTLLFWNNQKKRGIYLLKWIADYAHAENFLVPLFYSKNAGSGGNRSWFADAEVDAMLKKYDGSPKQTVLLQEMIREKAPWLFIGFEKEIWYVRKKVFFQVPITYSAISAENFGFPLP